MEMQDYKAAIEAATEPPEIWGIVKDALHKEEIEKVLYRHFPPLGAPDANVLYFKAEGFNEELVERYTEDELYRDDPRMKHAQIAPEPFYGDEVKLDRPEDAKLLKALQELGGGSLWGKGLGIPVFGPNGRNGLFGLSLGKHDKRFPKPILRDFQWICQLAHTRYCALLLPTLGPRPQLSKREEEILAWVARGKSNTSIAQILGISNHTVDAHLRRIFLKLNVVDRITATVRGLGVGLITS